MPLTAFSLRAFKPDTRETWAKSHKNGILPLTINLFYCHKIKSSAMPCKIHVKNLTIRKCNPTQTNLLPATYKSLNLFQIE